MYMTAYQKRAAAARRRKSARSRLGRGARTKWRNRRYLRPYPGGQTPPDGNPSTTLKFSKHSGVPQSMNVKLKYADRALIATSISGSSVSVIRLNSLFDPDFGVGGHQPMGFDQYAAFYNRYRVNAVKIKMTLFNDSDPSALASGPQMISIWPDYNLSGTAISIPEIMERPSVSYDIVGHSGSGSDRCKSITWFSRLHNFLGITKKEYDAEDSYSSLVSTNPTKLMNCVLQINDLALLTGLAFWWSYEVTYYATMYEPKSLPQS